MRIQYNGKSKILIRLAELVNQKADAEDLEQTAADLRKEIDEKADKSAIPTVGDGVLSVQRNGKSVGTFSANAAENEAINIPVPEKVSELGNDAGYGTYTKPTTGIPKSDLASGVQASLGKADTALQKHQDISGKLDKTGDASNTTVAFSAASARENVKTGEKLSVIVGKIAKWFADLKTVAFTGSYNDLANKPTIPDGSKYLPLAGGAMTGAIDMATNPCDLLVGTHCSISTGSYGTAIAGGAVDAKTSFADGLKVRKSIVGTYTLANGTWVNLISVRHRNGYGDGVNYGMYLYSILTSGGNLIWNKQTSANTWQGDRTLLDSANYTSWALEKNGTAVKSNALSTGHMKFGYITNWDATANDGYIWARAGYCVSGTGYDTITLTLLVMHGYAGAGLFSLFFRNSSDGKSCDNIGVEQICTNKPSYISNDQIKFIAVYTGTEVRYELWYKITSRWSALQFICVGEQRYAGANSNSWVFEKRTGSTFQKEPTAGNKEATYLNNGVVAIATTLTDSGWVAMTLGSYAASGTVQYRTYGKQITITGSIVLKTEIKPTPKAPQAIANTKLDFSKIKRCSGCGRSSTGIGIYVQAERYSDSDIVDVFSIGSNIAAGATLYFTITGFID